MKTVLIVGGTRGLGASLVKHYASQDSTTVYGTTRGKQAPDGFPSGVIWLTEVDLTKPDVGQHLSKELEGERHLDIVIISAGVFKTEDFSASKGPNWADELAMYQTCAMAPVFIVHALAHGRSKLKEGTKVVLVSSEAGSITLRHRKEGGGNYAHHAAKAALNMAGKLLSIDLRDRGVVVSIVHPGFMRTEMTRSVGFDKHWDEGGAVTPDEAAKSLSEWTEKLDMSKSGEYWAPRGPRDIGMATTVLGDNLPTPLQLPW
ncbi:oxidoreductase [Xylariomycetidae sp. FL0641]|nr:oxidoreductase [Xylariomycetidae sp. FL0641]